MINVYPTSSDGPIQPLPATQMRVVDKRAQHFAYYKPSDANQENL
jgi:hypothetical protein